MKEIIMMLRDENTVEALLDAPEPAKMREALQIFEKKFADSE